jgi:predicted nucleic acid-binding protein
VKLLLDADILLDTALDREPFVVQSDSVIRWCQETPQSALVAWHSVSNVYYLLRAARNDAKARNFVADLLHFVVVASGGTPVVRQALILPMSDFEDALQTAAAISANADFIVTRNVQDFRRSPLPALTPSQFLQKVSSR